MENSIEKDEEILNNIKAYMQENINKGYHKFIYNDLGYEEKCADVINAIEHILQDYKRVLKENELLRKDIEGWKKYCEEIEEEQTEMSNKNCELEFEIEKLQKENEELKQDRNNNNEMVALAQNEMLGYIQGYEDGKKLKRSAVACVVENQQYYIIKKEIEHYKEHIVKLQKENEELKEEKEQAWEEWNNLEQGSYETEQKLKQQIKELQKENEELKERIREHTLLISPYYVKENFIPVQRVKDKISERQFELQQQYKDFEDDSILIVLQELIEEREEK